MINFVNCICYVIVNGFFRLHFVALLVKCDALLHSLV